MHGGNGLLGGLLLLQGSHLLGKGNLSLMLRLELGPKIATVSRAEGRMLHGCEAVWPS